MKNIRFLFLSLLLFNSAFSQYFRIPNDSILAKSELILENSTKGRTGAFIKNKVNGRTEFAYAVDSIYTGHDTIFFHRGDGWKFMKMPAGYTDAAARAANAGLYPSLSVSYVNPSWIASLPYSKITGAPAPGAGTSENNSGTVAQISAMTTTIGKVYISTDRGGGLWADAGPFDGQVNIDSIKYLRSANNRLLKKLGTEPIRASWFGAISGDGIDDRAAIQAAINYGNDHSAKQFIWDGDYNLSDSVLDRRGGMQYIGLGALLREESWGGSYPSVYTQNEPFKGSSMIIAPNKRGIVFASTVVDPVKFKGIQFIKDGNRAPGTTTAIAFRSEFTGPTWPFIIEECHFRGFNYAIKFESPVQYAAAFVRIEDNAFSQNDECVYFGDLPLNTITSIGQRNAVWGFRFTGNKCHDNSRIIRANLSFDKAYIGFNNGEGNISYSAGGYPHALIDFEFSKTTVELEGNHFEGVVGVRTCVLASSQYKLSNGTYQALTGTTQYSSENRLKISGGNSFNGVTGVNSVEAVGCQVVNEDPIIVKGSGLFFDNTNNNLNGLMLSDNAKILGSTYKFRPNTSESKQFHKNDLAWSRTVNFDGGTRNFVMNTPVGVRQMVYTASNLQPVITTSYGGMDYSNDVKYIGVTYLINSSHRSEFFGSVIFYYSYTDSAGTPVSGAFETNSNLAGSPIGWSYLTAYFPNFFPKNSTARAGYFGLQTGELINESILVSTDYTIFGVRNNDPFVVPYFSSDRYTRKSGTFLSGQSFTDLDGIFNVAKSTGTAGTLTGVTATGSLFGRYVTVNDATNILPGQILNILGYPYTVANVNADTVFLSSPLNDNLSNTQVTYQQPTFDTYVNSKMLTDSLNARGIGGGGIDYSTIIRNQTATQSGANFKIDGIGHAAFLWADNDLIGNAVSVGNWYQYISNSRFVTRDQAYARQHMELIPGPNDATALTWLHSGLAVEGPTSFVPATSPTGAVILSQLYEKIDSAARPFYVGNASGTGDTLFVANTDTLKAKRIEIVGASKVVTADKITYTVNGLGNTGNIGFTGDGSTTAFTFVTSAVPGYTVDSKLFFTAMTTMGGAVIEWVDQSDESFTIHFTTAPTSGAKSLKYLVVP